RPRALPSFPTRRSSDLCLSILPHKNLFREFIGCHFSFYRDCKGIIFWALLLEEETSCISIRYCTHSVNYWWQALHQNHVFIKDRSEEHTSELQSRENLV